SLVGLKCGPAESKEGGSHLPTAWIWNACSPAGTPLSAKDSGWSLQEIDGTDLLAALVVKHGLGRLGHGRQSPGGRQQRRCADRSHIFQNRHDPTPRRGAPDGRVLEGSTWETHGGARGSGSWSPTGRLL